MCLVRERERGTWESLLATPINAAEALAGKLAPYLVIGVLETLLLLGLVHWLFGVPLPAASLALVAGLSLVCGILSAARLCILGARANPTSGSSISGRRLFAVAPAVRVSVPFFRDAAMGEVGGRRVPLTHYLRASREILLRQAPAQSVLGHLGPIIAFTGRHTGGRGAGVSAAV